jgi:hypothetical protein
VIFATWFTYDLEGKPWWLSMTASRTSDYTYAGIFYQTTGPAFSASSFEPSLVVASAVGQGSLTFTDANTAMFRYEVDGVSQTKTVTRQIFGRSPPTCAFGVVNNLAQLNNYQDMWWASPPGSESGWGINITHQDDTLFATWFTYGWDESPTWMSMTATKMSTGVYAGALYQTTGPAYDAVPFNPAKVMRYPIGSATFTFADGNSAIFAYTVNGISRSKQITRQVFRTPGTACA